MVYVEGGTINQRFNSPHSAKYALISIKLCYYVKYANTSDSSILNKYSLSRVRRAEQREARRPRGPLIGHKLDAGWQGRLSNYGQLSLYLISNSSYNCSGSVLFTYNFVSIFRMWSGRFSMWPCQAVNRHLHYLQSQCCRYYWCQIIYFSRSM